MLSREMKDSGVEWIGEIPSGWKVTKLRNCLSRPITDGPHETPKYTEEGVPFLSVNAITSDGKINRNIANKISKVDAENYNIKTNLQEGDILFTKSASIGKTAIIDKVDFMVWSPIAVIKTNKIINNKFLDFVFQTDGYLKQVINLGTKNTQVNVGMRAMEQAKVPLPSLRYQGMIVSEISNKTKKINKIIKETEQSIEELKKYKQSLITEVVTKGLDKNVEMKDSGIEWIGEIPSKWNIVKLKYFLKRERSIMKTFNDETVLSLTKKGIIKRDLINISGKMPSSFDGYQFIESGNILLCLFDIDVTPRCVGLIKSDGIISPAYTQFKFISQISKEYVYFVLLMLDNDKTLVSLSKNLRNSITSDEFLNIKIPVPPYGEQLKIISYIEHQLSIIEKLITQKYDLISEYEVYKKSLIYEYVTGKKEVGEEEK